MSPNTSCAAVAVVLVAGVGQRLRPLTDHCPKALVEIGPESILSRAVRLLVSHGVRDIVLATGFEQHAVRCAMKDCSVRVHYRHNPSFATTQNSISLLACADAVAGRSFYRLDGDLVFHSDVLSRLDASQADIAVAVDSSVSLGEEEMKVALSLGTHRITEFGKRMDVSRAGGESIGIERVNACVADALFRALQAAHAAGQQHLYYEEVYSRLLADGVVAEAIEVGDLPWVEVDTAQDLDRARQLVASEGISGGRV